MGALRLAGKMSAADCESGPGLHSMGGMWLSLVLAVAPVSASFPAPLEVAAQSLGAECRAEACTSNGVVKVCKCGARTEASNDFISVERPNVAKVEYPVASWASAVADFAVMAVDLDADGADEIIVANRSSEASGVNVRTWQVAIVDGQRAEAATHFVSHDWGVDFVKGSQLLVTEWDIALPKAAFVGREYAYHDGRLEPTRDPIRRRELDAEFEAERKATAAAATGLQATPRKWLSNKAAVSVVNDPLPASRQDAVVRGLTLDEPALDLHLERLDGRLETFSTAPEEGPALRLADAKTKRLYPLGYAPENSETWLLGRRVSLVFEGEKANGLVWVGRELKER